MPQIVIVGAGISGLALAYRLQKALPDSAITVLEQQGEVGGNVKTLREQGFQVETGPNGFLDSKPSTLQLCRDLGLGEQLISASEASRKQRYIFLDGKLQQLPGSLWSFLRFKPIGSRSKFRLLTEAYRSSRPPEDDESIHDFVTRRTSSEVADVFADALVTGIHAGDPRELSVAACFPRLVEYEKQYASILRGFTQAARAKKAAAKARKETPQPQRMWSFRTGLGTLIETLCKRITDPSLPHPVQLRTNVRARQVRASGQGWQVDADQPYYADVVVLACPTGAQAALLSEHDSKLAEQIAGITYNRIVVVALGFSEQDAQAVPDGFGYIAPQRTRRDILGVQWCSSIFPERAPHGMVLWRVLCGGRHRGEILDWDDARILEAVSAELRLALGVLSRPTFHRIIRWPQAIPQYFVGHPARVKAIEDQLAHSPGLFVTGNAYHGVALNDCTEQAELLAQEISRQVSTRQAFPGIMQ